MIKKKVSKGNHLLYEDIFDKVLEIPIEQVISKYIQIRKRNSYIQALCPFHANVKFGAFSIHRGKNIFKCFGCGEGGNAIAFVSKYENIGYFEACMKIAKDFGIISFEDFDKIMSRSHESSREIFVKTNKVINKMDIESDLEKENPRADTKTLHDVYKVFARGNSLVNRDILSKEHLKHLTEERGLSLKDIKRGGYFTFPSNNDRNFYNQLEKELKRMGYKEDVLKYVPGFYYNEEKKRYEFTYSKGIGYTVKNSFKQIEGIHIRSDKPMNGIKYCWFSSSNANYKEGKKWGNKTSSPIDVIYPTEFDRKNPRIIVTEGRFKGEILKNTIKSTVLSVQGVGNWRNIIKEIEKTKRVLKVKYNIDIKEVCVAFDSDMCENVQVLNYAKDLIKTLMENGYKTKAFLWDMKYGKGIDDLILSKNTKMLDKMEGQEFVKRFNVMNDYLINTYEIESATLLYQKLYKRSEDNKEDLKNRKEASKKAKEIVSECFEINFLSLLPKYRK